MAGKNTAVFGIYAKQPDFKKGLYQLKESGFRHEDISVLVPENMGTKELATEKATKAPEGATAGASSGAVVGGVLGWLVGIGTLTIPGVGPLLVGEPQQVEPLHVVRLLAKTGLEAADEARGVAWREAGLELGGRLRGGSRSRARRGGRAVKDPAQEEGGGGDRSRRPSQHEPSSRHPRHGTS